MKTNRLEIVTSVFIAWAVFTIVSIIGNITLCYLWLSLKNHSSDISRTEQQNPGRSSVPSISNSDQKLFIMMQQEEVLSLAWDKSKESLLAEKTPIQLETEIGSLLFELRSDPGGTLKSYHVDGVVQGMLLIQTKKSDAEVYDPVKVIFRPGRLGASTILTQVTLFEAENTGQSGIR